MAFKHGIQQHLEDGGRRVIGAVFLLCGVGFMIMEMERRYLIE